MNDRSNDAWNMVFGVGGCFVLMAYAAVCFFASVALLHEYWEFNLFVAILIAVLALRFAPVLMAIGTVLGAWLVWEWPLVALFHSLNSSPCALILGTLLGEDQTTFFILFGEDERLDALSHFDQFAWINIVANRKLTRWDDTFCFVSDIDENFVAIYLNDCSFDEISVIEILDCSFDGGEEISRAPYVINCDTQGAP